MDRQQWLEVLKRVAEGELAPEEALTRIQHLPYEDLGFAKIDYHRAVRCGFPEVVFCQGKRPEEVAEIFRRMAPLARTVLGTRADEMVYAAVRDACPEVEWYPRARCLVCGMPPQPVYPGKVLILTAGTADLPVAEEALVCARAMGNRVELVSDVGVAGLHRLLDHRRKLDEAAVVIVVAGMEGALASVVGGLTDKPVIAVPTSVGYGANFQGLAALLTMLNSCAPGVAVVNIDNGFGAAAVATAINRLLASGETGSGSP